MQLRTNKENYKVDSISFTTLSAALLLIIHYLRYMYINKTVLSWAVMQCARNKLKAVKLCVYNKLIQVRSLMIFIIYTSRHNKWS